MEYPDDVVRAVAERALAEWDLGAAKLEVGASAVSMATIVRPAQSGAR